MSKKLNDESNDRFKENVDPQKIFRNQWILCNEILSSGDDTLFGVAVLALKAALPPEKQVEVDEEEIDYTDSVEEYEYKSPVGWKMGTQKPVYRNLPNSRNYNPRLEQIEIIKKIVKKKDEAGEEYETEVEEKKTTYGQPVLVSPILKKYDKINNYKLFLKVLKKSDEADIGWQRKRKTRETNRCP